jgi:hypothetical protein
VTTTTFGTVAPNPDRLVRAADLVGAHELAHRLRYKNANSVSLLARRDPSFPAPVAHLARAGIWAWPDVESWARARGRAVRPPGPDAAGA